MALTFIFNIEGVSSDLSTAILTDLSVYGGANPDRDTLALYTYLYKRSADLVDTAIVLDNTSPLTVNQYSFSLPDQDGIFSGITFAFIKWQAGTYAQNDCVYYVTDGNYYIAASSTSSTPGSDASWTLITDILATCTGNASVQQGQFYAWSSAHSQSGPLGDAMADLGDLMRQGKCKSWEQSGAVMTGASAIESAFTNFRRANYTEAQKIIDWVQAQTALTI